MLLVLPVELTVELDVDAELALSPEDSEGDIDWMVDGLELTEYGDEATEGLTLSDGLIEAGRLDAEFRAE